MKKSKMKRSSKEKSDFDIVVVGAGISGAVIAERYASVLGKRVLIIEKKDHVAGHCYDYVNRDGLLVPKYGPHYFHTDSEKVWKYVSRFTDWIHYEHRVLSYVDGKLVPVPVNMTTINRLFSTRLKNKWDMDAWLGENVERIPKPRNSEEQALSQVGRRLYEKMFKHYTKKQWGLWPHELDASVIRRIPVRANFDDRYYSHKYQSVPKQGYTKLIERVLDHPNITVRLGADFMKVRKEIKGFERLFFTGRIDQYFSGLPELTYRSLQFRHQTLNKEFYQSVSVVNYPNDHAFTRITEPKHATKQKNKKTTIIKEYPADNADEPFYPIMNPRNREIYARYEARAKKLKNVHFLGRLANYSYIDMDQAFLKALELFESLK